MHIPSANYSVCYRISHPAWPPTLWPTGPNMPGYFTVGTCCRYSNRWGSLSDIRVYLFLHSSHVKELSVSTPRMRHR